MSVLRWLVTIYG